MNDYIYKGQGDTIRVKIFKRESAWDYDAFFINGDFLTFSEDAAYNFSTKRDALEEAVNNYGKLVSINPSTVTQGWDNHNRRLP